MDYPHKGKVSRAYVYRCHCCPHYDIYEWTRTDRLLLIGVAHQYARQDGWSKKKNGWTCPSCVQLQKERIRE